MWQFPGLVLLLTTVETTGYQIESSYIYAFRIFLHMAQIHVGGRNVLKFIAQNRGRSIG